MSRELLFLMSAEQAARFAELLAQANTGDGDAACVLGDLYREGAGGLRYSPGETYRWYARSAMAGDANGQNNLGACYEHGLGCRQSYARAVKWYRLSLAQELGTAAMNLGYCHLRGHGMPADKREALRLFRQAVEWGELKAAPEVERLEGSVAGPAMSPPVTEIRFVDETVAGAQLGWIGVDGKADGDGDAAPADPSRLTVEEWRDRDLRSYTKDDCFDMPKPASAADESLQRAVDRMERWQKTRAAAEAGSDESQESKGDA
jgi:hypothetical protein